MAPVARVWRLLVCFALIGARIMAQEILTAENLFAMVSETFGSIKDFEADFRVTNERDDGLSVSWGKIYYKAPDLLLLEYAEPEDQVVLSNGDELIIYIPFMDFVVKQRYQEQDVGAEALVSPRGLEVLRRNYGVAYLVGPDPVALDEADGADSEGDEAIEMVRRLRFSPFSTLEQFRELIISVSEDNLIRRIAATTNAYEKLTVDFTDVKADRNIPESRFDYDSPADANVYMDFLYGDE